MTKKTTKISRTFKEILELNAVIGMYLGRMDGKKSSLKTVIEKFAKKQLAEAIEFYNDELARISDKCASKDPKGNIQIDEQGRNCFNEEGREKQRMAIKALQRNETFSFEPAFITSEEVPTDLTDVEIEYFKDIFIP
jgi:hypothetical protein